MPKEFTECVDSGGRVRTVSGPNKEHGLGEGEYVRYCYKGDKSYRGEVKTKKAQLSLVEVREICPTCAEKMEQKGMIGLRLNNGDIDKALAKSYIGKEAAKRLRVAIKRKSQKYQNPGNEIVRTLDILEGQDGEGKLIQVPKGEIIALTEQWPDFYTGIWNGKEYYFEIGDTDTLTELVKVEGEPSEFESSDERVSKRIRKRVVGREVHKPNLSTEEADLLHMRMLDYLIFTDDPQYDTIVRFRNRIDQVKDEGDKAELKKYFESEFSGVQERVTAWDYYAKRKGRKVEGMAVPIEENSYGVSIGTQFFLKSVIEGSKYQELTALAKETPSVQVQRLVNKVRIGAVTLVSSDFKDSHDFYRLTSYLSGIIGGSELGYSLKGLRVQGFRGKSLFGLKNVQGDEQPFEVGDKVEGEEVLLRGIDTPEAAKQFQLNSEYKDSIVKMDDLNPGRFMLVRKAQTEEEKEVEKEEVERLWYGIVQDKWNEVLEIKSLEGLKKWLLVNDEDYSTGNFSIDSNVLDSLWKVIQNQKKVEKRTAQTEEDEEQVLSDAEIDELLKYVKDLRKKKEDVGLTKEEEKELEVYKNLLKEEQRYREHEEDPGVPPYERTKTTLPKKYKKPVEEPIDLSKDVDLITLFDQASKITSTIEKSQTLIDQLLEKARAEQGIEENLEKLEGVWKEIRKKIGDQPGRIAQIKDRVYAIMNQIRRAWRPSYMKIAETLVKEFGDMENRMAARYEQLRKTTPNLKEIFMLFTAPMEVYRKFKGSKVEGQVLAVPERAVEPNVVEQPALAEAPIEEVAEGTKSKIDLLDEATGYSYDLLDALTGLADDLTILDFTISEAEDELEIAGKEAVDLPAAVETE